MLKTKFDEVRELIQQKDYKQARALLKKIDHPAARQWETKLGGIAPRKANPKGMTRGKKLRLGLLLIGIAVIIVFIVQENQHRVDIANRLNTIATQHSP